VAVPLDYADPGRATIELAVSRAPALDPGDPGGSLFFNPGGPGESGNQILPVVLSSFPPSVRQRYDLVTFDPRGTGASDSLQCGTSPALVASLVPVPDQPDRPLPGTPVFTAMARACAHEGADLTPEVDTINTARDMDRIRQALGLSTIAYYGLSYGTELGAVYAELFPHRLSAMVLDGAVDVNASLVTQAVQEAPAAEASIDHLLAACGERSSCPLGAHPFTFYRDLQASLSRHPLPAPGRGDDVPVTVGDLDTAALLTVSVPSFTSLFDSALVDAAHGDGTGLRSLSLEFVTDINGASLVDALWAVTCNDAAVHPGPAQAGTLAFDLARRYPLLGGYASTYTMGGCVAWPAPRHPVTDIHPVGTPPVLVIGNTGDPNTPIIGARHLTAAIPSARLATWVGWGHTWLLSGPGDPCMQRVVATYLGGGGLPPRGTVCR
jgi:pimeloyl-ACP methyl ester carboxylesterase